MTANMQKVLMVLGIIVVGALLWVGLVGPARDDADAAKSAQTQAETAAAAVAGQLATAKQAAERTPENARTLRRLAVAVPEKVEAPALIDQLDSTARRYGVSFDVLKVSNGAASAAPTATPTATTAATPAGTAADGSAVPGTPGTPTAPAGSLPVELNVELAGTYVAVTKFVKAVQADVRTKGGTKVSARGRLLRIESVDLSADGEGGGKTLKGTLSVVAYLLPKDSAAAPTATTGTATTPGAPAATTGTATTPGTPTTTGSTK